MSPYIHIPRVEIHTFLGGVGGGAGRRRLPCQPRSVAVIHPSLPDWTKKRARDSLRRISPARGLVGRVRRLKSISVTYDGSVLQYLVAGGGLDRQWPPATRDKPRQRGVRRMGLPRCAALTMLQK